MRRLSDYHQKLLEPAYVRLKYFFDMSQTLPRPSGFFHLADFEYKKNKNNISTLALYSYIDSITGDKNIHINDKDKIVAFMFKTMNESVKFLGDIGEIKTPLNIKTKGGDDLMFLSITLKPHPDNSCSSKDNCNTGGGFNE